MWHKGYTHYHTNFHYPSEQRITPRQLAEDLEMMGASFAFCAGDHGDSQGNNYWGIDVREVSDYKEACLSVSQFSNVILIPAPEMIHFMFPPFNERHEHHSCVPVLNHIPKANPPETKALAASYTRESDNFISECNKHNISLTLNHPHLSVTKHIFDGPPPLDIPSFCQVDYLELWTIDHPDYFFHDFELYLKFLSRPASCMMACCSGVDNASMSCKLPSTMTRTVPSTLLFVPGKLSIESLMQAWNQRQSCAVYGDLYLEKITPVPSKKVIKGVEVPNITMSVKHTAGKNITKAEVYRNGVMVYKDEVRGKDTYTLNWEDKKPLAGKTNYIVNIEATGDYLTTSPINFFMD